MEKVRLKEIWGRFNRLVRGSERAKFAAVEALIDQLGPGVPSYSIEYGRAAVAVLRLGSLVGERQDEWISLAMDIDAHLYARGYRSNGQYMTVQEHKLIGSSHHPITKAGTARLRYTPLGVLTGEISAEEAATARQLAAVIRNYPLDMYFITGNCGACPEKGMLSLEPLDGSGMTVRDPRPLRKEKFENGFDGRKGLGKAFDSADMRLTKVMDFPFARNAPLADDDSPPEMVRDL